MSRSIGHIMLEAALDWECDLRWDRAHTFISGMPSTKDHENEVMRVLVDALRVLDGKALMALNPRWIPFNVTTEAESDGWDPYLT